MKRQPIVSHLVVALVVGMVAGTIGFWQGSRIGVKQFAYADAKYKASILAHQIQTVKRQTLSNLEVGMQLDLNNQLAKHGAYLESPWTWLWPDLESTTDREIRGAVKFRLENPYSEPDLSSPSNWKPGIDMSDPFVLNTIAGQQQSKKLMEKVLDRYGK